MDPDPTLVYWTIWALAEMEQSAAGAIPALDRLTKSKSQPELIKSAAKDAIDQITNGKKKN